MPQNRQETWEEFRLHLRNKLSELEDLKKEVSEMRVQLAILTTRLMLYSVAAASIISIFAKYLLDKLTGGSP